MGRCMAFRALALALGLRSVSRVRALATFLHASRFRPCGERRSRVERARHETGAWAIIGSSMASLPHSEIPFSFFSPPPRVRLVNAFARPFENVVATARTCYSSKGIVTEDQASARPERRDALARSIYEAGHHTTFQHAHFQFALENVSRQFLWTFLHSHPFYNSEQVSQRYVEVQPRNFAVPPLPAVAREIYEATARRQQAAYETLTRMLTPLVAERYFGLFPGRLRGEGPKTV